MPKRDLDLINRDPHGMNRYIEVEFDDVLAEPEGAHSADCVWRNAYKCFNCGRDLCYKILTYLCGICLGLYWGCVFACISFEAIWCWGPYLRALHIILHPVRKVYTIILSTFLGPFMETLGLFFSRIHVTNAQGQPPKPLGSIDGDDNQHNVKNFK